MPSSLVTSLLSFFASHLIVLTLTGFLVVGSHLAGFWTPDPAPLAPSGVAPADDPPTATPTVKSPQTSVPPPAEPRQQPVLIGGSLPNYGSAGDMPFRSPPVTTEPLQPLWSDREVLVQQARRAFWNGDFEGAETAYVRLISQYPDDADAFGELGNLYQSMGKAAEALDAYYAAAVRLRAAGKREKLSQVIDLLDTYDYPGTASLRP